MDLSSDVKKGQAVYSKPVLAFYDFWVLGISNRYIWKCPSAEILSHFNENISSNHMDIGVGTGYFLDKCLFPSPDPRIALMDLNQNSLDTASKRIERYKADTFIFNIMDKIDLDIAAFDSISLNYLFHCLPGKLSNKLLALDNISHLLTETGTLFGSTILSQGIKKAPAARTLMALYNKTGVFSNTEDTLEDLEAFLCRHYREYKIHTRGCVALFSASHKNH